MTLFYLACAWLAGIVLGEQIDAPWWVWLILAIPSLLGLIFARNDPRWRTVFGCVLLLVGGAARLSAATFTADEDDLAFYNNGGFVTVEGVIVDAPEVRDNRTTVRVRAESLTLADGTIQVVSGLALVEIPAIAELRYGDPVQVAGELITPPEYDDFSYQDYLAREGVHSMVRYAAVDVTGERRGSPIRAVLLDFRAATHERIQQLLPEPHASLLAGILLGIEEGIAPDVRADFNAVSASHVIAISGANMVIVAGLIQSVARRFFSVTVTGVVTIAGVMVYAVFVGGDPAVMRAAIMTSLALTASLLGRQTYGMASLGFAGVLMTAINPHTLWDVGFQLSFLATLGLILYVEPLQRGLAGGLARLLPAETAQKVMGVVSDAFVVTIAAQITTTPLITAVFGRWSPLSLPVNFLIVPAQPPIMIFGGLAVLAAFVFLPLGQLLAWASWLFLSWTIWIVRGFAGLPLASSEITLSTSGVIAIYAVIFGLTAYLKQSGEQRANWHKLLGRAVGVKALAGVGALVAALALAAALSLPDGRLHVTFIDVGDGTAALIETPTGRTILVDAGGSGRRALTGLGDALPFWQRRVDLLVITRPTPAHIGGLASVLDRYHLGAAIAGDVTTDSQTVNSAYAALVGQNVPRIAPLTGQRVSVGDGVTLTVLRAGSGDDESVALLLSYGDARILLPGDLSEGGRLDLLRSGLTGITVLHTTQGGIAGLNDPDLLDALSPQAAVVSIPAGELSGGAVALIDQVTDTGALIFRADEAGTIELVTDGRRLWVWTR